MKTENYIIEYFSCRCATLSCISPPVFNQSTDASNSRSSLPKASQHPLRRSRKVLDVRLDEVEWDLMLYNKMKMSRCRGTNALLFPTLKPFLSKWRCTSWGGRWWRRRLASSRPRGDSVGGRRLFTSSWLRWTTPARCQSNSTAAARSGGNSVTDRWVLLTFYVGLFRSLLSLFLIIVWNNLRCRPHW